MRVIQKLPVPVAFVLILYLSACTGEISRVPILILAREADFGTYNGEILKAEGFNEFIIDSIGSRKINKSYLEKFDIVILSEQLKDSLTWNIFSKYVKDGGNLITIDPNRIPTNLSGIKLMPGDMPGSSVLIDAVVRKEKAFRDNRIQLHTPAKKYALAGASPVAWFSRATNSENQFPAVVINSFGKGSVASFLYNLPRNIVYTRQGNPMNAGIEKDSIPGLRAMDMFTDGWVDTANNTVNQADLQMAILSYCIEKMCRNKKPLPRLWYFPDTLKCLVTLTNDGEFRGENDFENQFRDVDSMGAKMTLYVMKTDKVTEKWTDRWTARGFEIAGHPDDTRNAARPSWSDMELALSSKMDEVSNLYGLKMKTVVNHWFVWCGNDSLGRPEFTAQAYLEARHGLLLDINYAHYDNKSSQGHFLGSTGTDQGNFTGSGLPMRFASSTGRIIDIFQHLNNVYDQQYNENHDPDGFFSCFRGLMDRSLNDGIYSFISIKSHNDEYYFSKEPLMKMLAYSVSKGIPVWPASHLSDFIRCRDNARFSQIRWADNELSFNLNTAGGEASGLTFMLPLRFGTSEIRQVKIDGKQVSFKTRFVKGSWYSFNTIAPDKNYNINVRYGN